VSSARSQILTLLANHRIDVAQAERLLAIVGGSERFLTLTLGTILVAVAATINLLPHHAGHNLYAALQSTLQSVTASPAFHHLHLFFIRLLGELP
jgi:hypothetical protein